MVVSGSQAILNKDALNLVQTRYFPECHMDTRDWLSLFAEKITCLYEGNEQQQQKQRYEKLLLEKKFFPTSAALVNGLKEKKAMSGCIVMPIQQSLDAIMEQSIPEILKVMRQGIGVGLDLSILNPRLSEDPSDNSVFPGPVEILKSIVQCATPLMAYGGLKHAAFMGALSVHHPDIFEFIGFKMMSPLDGINISVTITEEFSKACHTDDFIPAMISGKNGEELFLASNLALMEIRAQRRKTKGPDLFLVGDFVGSKQAGCMVGKVKDGVIHFDASTIMDFLARCAHARGEPGLLNLPAINKNNPTQSLQSMSVTTPCGEQPLLPYEMCYLGSLCLPSFIHNDQFDFAGFETAVYDAVHMMDDIIDIDSHEHDVARAMCLKNRKIGIGVMGLADALATLNLVYGSSDGFTFVRHVMSVLRDGSRRSSEDLAKKRGPFPNWKHSQMAKEGRAPLRHATLTTLAPTGHISRVAGCSPSIEPYYSIKKNNQPLSKALEKIGYSLEKWTEDSLFKGYKFSGTLNSLCPNPTDDEELNEQLQRLQAIYVCAQELPAQTHLEMVHCLQQFVDNGISKTINLPSDITVQDVRAIFMEAIQLNLKGVTVFRDGCLI
jgi:ribonucleoside-diphosphate reductase alpha chain